MLRISPQTIKVFSPPEAISSSSSRFKQCKNILHKSPWAMTRVSPMPRLSLANVSGRNNSLIRCNKDLSKMISGQYAVWRDCGGRRSGRRRMRCRRDKASVRTSRQGLIDCRVRDSRIGEQYSPQANCQIPHKIWEMPVAGLSDSETSAFPC